MNRKIVQFENELSDLITESFTSKDIDSIKAYYGEGTLANHIIENIGKDDED